MKIVITALLLATTTAARKVGDPSTARQHEHDTNDDHRGDGVQRELWGDWGDHGCCYQPWGGYHGHGGCSTSDWCNYSGDNCHTCDGCFCPSDVSLEDCAAYCGGGHDSQYGGGGGGHNGGGHSKKKKCTKCDDTPKAGVALVGDSNVFLPTSSFGACLHEEANNFNLFFDMVNWKCGCDESDGRGILLDARNNWFSSYDVEIMETKDLIKNDLGPGTLVTTRTADDKFLPTDLSLYKTIVRYPSLVPMSCNDLERISAWIAGGGLFIVLYEGTGFQDTGGFDSTNRIVETLGTSLDTIKEQAGDAGYTLPDALLLQPVPVFGDDSAPAASVNFCEGLGGVVGGGTTIATYGNDKPLIVFEDAWDFENFECMPL